MAAPCDASRLESALLNLGSNARDAMPEGGRLVGETGNVAGFGAMGRAFVTLSVADSGTGMTPEVMGCAFDPFFTTKPAGQGTTMTVFLPQHFGAASERSLLEAGQSMCVGG